MLFLTSTLEGWPDYAYWFIDSDRHHPKRNNNKIYAVFFVVFITISAFFLMNLFTAVVSLNYTIAQEKIN